MCRYLLIVLFCLSSVGVVSAQTATNTPTPPTPTLSPGDDYFEAESCNSLPFCTTNGVNGTCAACWGGNVVVIDQTDTFIFGMVGEGFILWIRQATTHDDTYVYIDQGQNTFGEPWWYVQTHLLAGEPNNKVGVTIPAKFPGEYNRVKITTFHSNANPVHIDSITPLGYPALGLYPTQLPYPTYPPYYTQVPYYTQEPLGVEITLVVDELSIEFPTQIPYPTQEPYLTQIPPLTQIPYPTPDQSYQYATVIAPGDVDGQTVRFDWNMRAGDVLNALLLFAIFAALLALFVQRIFKK